MKDFVDRAETLRALARKRNVDLGLLNEVAEYKIRGEREIGAMLAEIVKHAGGRPHKPLHDEMVSDTTRLSDIGITLVQSHRYQQEARLPEKAFAQHIAQTKAAGEELTTAGVLVAESGQCVAVRRR